MAANPARLITADDKVVFVSGTTCPTPARPIEAKALSQVIAQDVKPFGILICGWHPVWEEPVRLIQRIKSMIQKLPRGSKILFLNMVGSEHFAELLQTEKDFVPSELFEDTWCSQGVKVQYAFGDPADFQTLSDVIAETQDCKFEVGIMLGTMAAVTLSPGSRDLRVLSTMMLLRKAHADIFGEKERFHVVGENCLDSTADLALPPIGARCSKDFVNTQAIIARFLVLSLAYPLMQPAVAQLASTLPGCPNIVVSEAGKQVVPFGDASFAQVTRAFAEKNAVCVGYMCKNGKMVVAPDPCSVHHYEEGDLLIIITRDPFFIASDDGDMDVGSPKLNKLDKKKTRRKSP
jgi:hypothetical protein